LKVYFDGAVAGITQASVNTNFTPLIRNKSPQEAVNLLLDFVQQLPYQKDGEQFGYEKFFFPAENLHYSYGDCEDRSGLFAYLVRELLGLKVTGLEYPGHIATAVHLPGLETNYSFKYKGDKYLICDATYKGAPMGQVIPRCQKKEARVLVLNNEQQKQKRARKLWKKVHKAGGYQGANHQNVAFNDEGHAFLTGYYEETLALGEQKGNVVENGREAFIAAFDETNELRWVKTLGGPGADMGYYLRQPANTDRIYLAGSFSKTISVSVNIVKTDQVANVFVAALNDQGKIQWLNQAGLDKVKTQENAGFLASFTGKGHHQWTRFFNPNPDFEGYGLKVDGSGDIMVKGGLHWNTGLRTAQMTRAAHKADVAFLSTKEFDAVNALKEKARKLKQQDQYHPRVLGLFAIIELIENSGTEIKGREVQKALNSTNPEFKSQNPIIYQNIGRIRLLKNANGVVKIQTHNQEAVSFSNMEIASGARMKIVRQSNGDARIEVLSGIEVGKAIVWYDLNAIKLHQDNPELVFDYSDDHSKKTVSMNELVD